MHPIEDIVHKLDVHSACKLLNVTQDIVSTRNQVYPLYHSLVRGLQKTSCSWFKARQLIYMLHYKGADINHRNENGDTSLHLYLTSPIINLSVLEAFLQCNADMYTTNNEGRTPLLVGLLHGGFSGKVKDVLMKYAPGLNQSIANGDIMNVRKLINQACSVDAALSTKSETISKLITDIRPSMNLLHASMAGDTYTVQTILTSSQTFNINFRNMGHYGSTALYYAICTNETDLIDLLLQHSARTDICLTINFDDMPMLIHVLSSQIITPQTLMHLFTKLSPQEICSIIYKGENILEASMKVDVDVELFRQILISGGASLLTKINHVNQSIRKQAEISGKQRYIDVMDQVVHDWCMNPLYSNQRHHLALRGFRHFTHPHSDDSLCENVLEFYNQLSQYRERVEVFHDYVKTNDVEMVQQNLLCGEFSKHFDPCLADSSTTINGQPALHKAVLRGHAEIVSSLGEAIVYLKGKHIDAIRDQFSRTALHYAMACKSYDDIVKILKDLGASEHTQDMNGESPSSFRDRSQLPLMAKLLQYHRDQNFNLLEPNVWKEPLPLPIISYLSRFKEEIPNGDALAITDRLSALSRTTHGHTHPHMHAHTHTHTHGHTDSRNNKSSGTRLQITYGGNSYKQGKGKKRYNYLNDNRGRSKGDVGNDAGDRKNSVSDNDGGNNSKLERTNNFNEFVNENDNEKINNTNDSNRYKNSHKQNHRKRNDTKDIETSKNNVLYFDTVKSDGYVNENLDHDGLYMQQISSVDNSSATGSDSDNDSGAQQSESWCVIL